MALARRTLVDDDGSGTTGTIIDNAEYQALQAVVDARWSEVSVTTTGTINNLSFSEADHLRMNNAAESVVTGLVAPASPSKPGKRLIVSSVGAADVVLNDEAAGSTAANRITTGCGQPIYLQPGSGRALLVYDAVSQRWKVVSHEQGAVITWNPTWTTLSGTAPALGNGTLTGFFYRSGRQIDFQIWLTGGTTTTWGNGGILQFSLPYAYTANWVGIWPVLIVSAGGLFYEGLAAPVSSQVIALYTNAAPMVGVTNASPFTFTSTASIRISGRYMAA